MRPGSLLLTAGLLATCAEYVPDCANNRLKIVSVSVVPPSECSVSDGAITAAVQGGQPPFSYWLDDNKVDLPLTRVAAGRYHLRVADYRGCSDTTTVAILAPSTARWKDDLQPIFTTRCAKAGCHVGTGRGDFSKLEDVLDNLKAVRHRVYTRSMPQDSPLDEAMVRRIICWIDSGAKE
jgi:hypothetical protein